MPLKDKVALFDIDDTIYKGGMIFPLMEAEIKDNLLEHKYLDEVYRDRALYRKGKLEYETLSTNVVTSWAAGLKGQSYGVIAKHAEQFISNDLHSFYPFTKPVLTLLEKTHDNVIITNEPQFVVEPILKYFNFVSYVSTIFQVVDGKFTGNVSRFNSTQDDKKKSIHEVFADYRSDQSFAFGDSVGDLGMFEEVTYSICVNASEKLKKIALKKGWQVVNGNNILEAVSKLKYE